MFCPFTRSLPSVGGLRTRDVWCELEIENPELDTIIALHTKNLAVSKTA